MSDLETETTSDTASFEMFGRDWTVPTKRHHQQIRRTKQIIREEGQLDSDDVAEIYLSAEDYDALLALNVDGEQLSEFAVAVAKALGMGDSGNSQPSPVSS